MKNAKLQELNEYILSMPVYDPSADEPDYYSGAEEVCKALKLFWKEKERIQKKDFENWKREDQFRKLMESFDIENLYKHIEEDEKEDFSTEAGEENPHLTDIPFPDKEPWDETNTFQVLTENRELIAFRNYGRHKPVPADFLFKTPFIPLQIDYPYNKKDLLRFASRTTEMLNEEIKNMLEKAGDKKPLFLTYYMEKNKYEAWSIKENAIVNIYKYKAYKKDFMVSYGAFGRKIKINPGNDYYIQPPSEELVAMLGLNLNPDIWQKKMPWDKWAKKEGRIPIDIEIQYNPDGITEQQKKLIDLERLYDDAVELANMGRETYFENADNAFTELENRLDIFEKLYKAGAPVYILENAMNRVQQAMEAIYKIIKD